MSVRDVSAISTKIAWKRVKMMCVNSVERKWNLKCHAKLLNLFQARWYCVHKFCALMKSTLRRMNEFYIKGQRGVVIRPTSLSILEC